MYEYLAATRRDVAAAHAQGFKAAKSRRRAELHEMQTRACFHGIYSAPRDQVLFNDSSLVAGTPWIRLSLRPEPKP